MAIISATLPALQKGATAANFRIIRANQQIPECYPSNQFYFRPKVDGTNFSIEHTVTNVPVMDNKLFSNVINGDTGVAFASLDAVRVWCETNFFV